MSIRGKATNRANGYQGRSKAWGEDCDPRPLLWGFVGEPLLENWAVGGGMGSKECADTEEGRVVRRSRFDSSSLSVWRFWRKVRTPGARALHFGESLTEAVTLSSLERAAMQLGVAGVGNPPSVLRLHSNCQPSFLCSLYAAHSQHTRALLSIGD